jgi:hypothetical protein
MNSETARPEGGHLKLFKILGMTPEGTCPECATAHPEWQPHNQQSLTYQYKFYDKHGRFPTWEDAMEHCSETVKGLWKTELLKKGIKVGEPQPKI